MKIYIKNILTGILLLLLVGSCTDEFNKYNTNPYQIPEADPPTLLKPMIERLVNIQQNDSQMFDQMVGQLGGYFVCSNSFSGTNFGTFNQSDDWNAVPWNNSFEKIYGNFFRVEEATNSMGHYYAFAKMIRAIAMLRVVDCYGPMPYSQVKKGNFYTAYDTEKQVYENILDDLANAADVLFAFHTSSSGFAPLEGHDPVFDGNYLKWVKLANSMRLRVSIRISTAYPDLAKQNAENAVTHEGGLLEANSDNAMLDCGAQTNPYNLASVSWGDLRVNANIVDYMKGYEDPRMSEYFEPSTFNGNYEGMRSGENGFDKSDVSDYSLPNYTGSSKLLVFCAAETAFLRAEGKLKGWNVGSKTAKEYYEEGISLSMDQYKLKMPDTYLTSDNKPIGHRNDPRGKKYDCELNNTVTVGWGDNDEENLQRIITQKWIANYPLGLEAWAEYRRTGYPELYPVIDNLSTAGVDSKRGMRRLRYPYTEAQNNTENYQKGVSYLGGPDNEATELGWTKKN
ncbi:MAG: SusD/RagB family nutrient-binding outer membrane lipoprotein [Bacteroidales bacterium]|nr:SusD/RagB family nutrient-binding outer membrane lipoprotein [Bacteroidales bacterium]